MTLLDGAPQARRLPGPPCGVGVITARLSADEAADLATLLADVAVRGSDIARALQNRGHSVTPFMLSWHRRGACSCGRR